MLKRINLINILLLVILFFLARQTLQLWSHSTKKAGSSTSRKTTEKTGQLPLEQKVGAPKDSFKVITEKNLFHPQRKGGEGTKKEGQRESIFPEEIVTKEITLYGTLIFGDYRIAVLGESNVPRQNKGIRKVGIGDSFAGFQVVDISPNKVILRNDNETKTLFLYKPKGDRRISLSPPVTNWPIPSSPLPIPPPIPGKPEVSPQKTLPEIFRGALQGQ